jgi:hypothetical protein
MSTYDYPMFCEKPTNIYSATAAGDTKQPADNMSRLHRKNYTVGCCNSGNDSNGSISSTYATATDDPKSDPRTSQTRLNSENHLQKNLLINNNNNSSSCNNLDSNDNSIASFIANDKQPQQQPIPRHLSSHHSNNSSINRCIDKSNTFELMNYDDGDDLIDLTSTSPQQQQLNHSNTLLTSDMYSDDIDYMNSYLRSLPNYDDVPQQPAAANYNNYYLNNLGRYDGYEPDYQNIGTSYRPLPMSAPQPIPAQSFYPLTKSNSFQHFNNNSKKTTLNSNDNNIPGFMGNSKVSRSTSNSAINHSLYQPFNFNNR